MRVSRPTLKPQASTLTGLLTIVVLLVAAAITANALMTRQSAPLNNTEDAAPVTDPGQAPLPAWDGSATSTLPSTIERKVRRIQNTSDQRQNQLQRMLAN